MPDVLLRQTSDGGEINVSGGVTGLSPDGLESAVFLSLFGGNEDDSGSQGDERLEWWGNRSETEVAKKYRSETQFLVRSLSLNTASLQRIEDAATRDLAWILESVATSLEIVATMPALNTVKLQIFAVINDRVIPFSFIAKKATSA